jgi:hypothetical protein
MEVHWELFLPLKSFSSENLSAREFEGLCNILSQIVLIYSKNPAPAISAILMSIISQLETEIQGGSLNKNKIKLLEEKLSRVSLFKAIFQVSFL